MSANLARLRPHASADLWLPWGTPRASARIRIFCLPYAGGGASIFREVAAALPHEIDLCPIQLPGRESRIGEPALRSLGEMTPALVDVLRQHCNRPYALLGYSMGAIVAYDLALGLARANLRQPEHLIVCARKAPASVPALSGVDLDSDDALYTRLRSLGGTSETIFGQPELLSLMTPTLKADFAVNASFDQVGASCLSAPLLAIGGLVDAEVTREDLEAWAAVTTGTFALRLVRGDHFFMRERAAEFAAAVARAVLTHG